MTKVSAKKLEELRKLCGVNELPPEKQRAIAGGLKLQFAAHNYHSTPVRYVEVTQLPAVRYGVS